ncbi:MAG: glycerol kinase GlpK [Cohaesibacteraceae bacterium]
MSFILAIDQGTTSTRSIIYDDSLTPIASAQEEFPQIYPADGWVEHDAEVIWQTVDRTIKAALDKAGMTAGDLAAIGITNQRETVVVWDKATGKPVGHAIVWQDRRTASVCQKLKADGHEAMVQDKTGLLLDPYFSGTKLGWMLDQDAGLRARAEAGKVLFGTVDSFLIHRLTAGKAHVTDATNACRTLLFDINTQSWSDELLALLNVPKAMLPEVLDCADDFGVTDPSVFGASVPIYACAGDQHAATIGQACFTPGMVKATYGTGLFAVLNTGDTKVPSKNRLLTTLAYRLNGKPTYALEGSVFIAGAAVQWLRDGMKIIESAPDINGLAGGAKRGSLTLVPAFVGLGAPYWDPDARGAVYGITRDTGPADFALAVLESVAFQTRDLLDAMARDWPDGERAVLRVDGVMTHSDLTLQLLADTLDAPVERPDDLETTARGVAYLAGMKAGLCPDLDTFAANWKRESVFQPQMSEAERAPHLARWQDAIKRTLSGS